MTESGKRERSKAEDIAKMCEYAGLDINVINKFLGLAELCGYELKIKEK